MSNEMDYDIDPLTRREKIGAFLLIAVIYIAHDSFIVWLFS